MARKANEEKTPKAKQEYNREYYRKNRERLIAAASKHYFDNHEKRKEQKNAYHAANKERRNAESRAWYKKNRLLVIERNREQSRLYRFAKHGLTEQEYLEMSAAQGGVCAICANECDVRKSLSVDHDHQTGVVRGLLCGRCNSGIGFLRESREILVAAIHYLDLAAGRATK